jgi:NDP-sugar pyrophosphorylase family protein/aminoglycoside/choline kinase family phosphotransferase
LNFSIFILAAGFGERLRPVTDHIPKPLLPILGKPILQYILEKVANMPVHRIGINLSHKKEAIIDWIHQSPYNRTVHLFSEDPNLGTGGGLKNAEAFLKNSAFLVHNSDIVSDIDLQKLVEFHSLSQNLVTLAVHNYPEFNKLEIDEKGFLKGVLHHPYPNHSTSRCRPPELQSEPVRYLAFTGIAIYQPEFLKFLPTGISSVVDTWLKALCAGYKIGTIDVSGCYWRDIGTPVSYTQTATDELRKNGEIVYIHPSTCGCRYVEIDGYIVMEKGSSLDKGASLRNCIMLPGSRAECYSHYENCILGPGFTIVLSESDFFDASKENDAILIGTGGSDRKYYRVTREDKSVVFLQCLEGDTDFHRHLEYTRFLSRHSIPVPELIQADTEKMNAFFEDLGDLSLYSWLKCPYMPDEIEDMYKKVLDILTLIHTRAHEHISECMLLQNKLFDYEHLRWETSYFIERFVEGIRDIRVKNLSGLNDEFHKLASIVDSYSKTVVHRDFQSQNIMITKGRIPRVVDYQGARIGPPAYDVVSLLWDPYYRLEDDMRKRLLNYYIKRITNPPKSPFSKGGFRGITENEFRETLLPCRLQRHMQALGAYGFLSKIKGKKYFLKYVPEGLRLLKEDVSPAKDEYPELYDLVMRL